MLSVPRVELNNGNQMPVIGLGTYLVSKMFLEFQLSYQLLEGYHTISIAHLEYRQRWLQLH